MWHILRHKIFNTRGMKIPSRLEMPDPAEWSTFASDPASDSALLEALCESAPSPEILAALARNPATPFPKLRRLWMKDPAAILENPIVLLWEFTKAGSVRQKITRELQFRLYQHLLVQEVFDPKPALIELEVIVNRLERIHNARHLELPLHAFVRDDRYAVRRAILGYSLKRKSRSQGYPVAFPTSAIELLADDPNYQILAALAEAIAANWLRPEPMDSSFLARLAGKLVSRSGGPHSIAVNVAKWPCLDADLVEKLARRADEKLLSVLAAHPSASDDFQARMASHESEIVRAGVAASARSVDLIHKLAMDSNPFVRASLATLRGLPPTLQQRLYESKDPRILQALLQNPSTTGKVLEEMYKLPFLPIGEFLRNHPNTPRHIIEKLPKRVR